MQITTLPQLQNEESRQEIPSATLNLIFKNNESYESSTVQSINFNPSARTQSGKSLRR